MVRQGKRLDRIELEIAQLKQSLDAVREDAVSKSEAHGLQAAMIDSHARSTEILDRLQALSARMAARDKREQAKAAAATPCPDLESPEDSPKVEAPADRKAALRKRLRASGVLPHGVNGA